MIDLKNEIEVKLKYAKNLYDNINENDNGYLKSYFLGTIQSYETILKCLENHNIITAPKTIKLSEVIDKICDTNYKSECWVEPIRLGKGNYKIRTQYGDGYWGDYDFYIEDKKIVMYQDDYLLPFDKFKWLYALWIAGTIIEDDLQEEE